MAIDLDPTVGGASSNSFASLDEALAYFATRLGGGAFTNESVDNQAMALIAATRRINAETYRGAKASALQALAWPRTGTWKGGQPLPSDANPDFVKEAEYEEALALLVASKAGTVDPMAASGTDQFRSLGVGDIRLDFRDPAPDEASRTFASPQAYRLLREYIITDLLDQPPNGTRNVRILRGS